MSNTWRDKTITAGELVDYCREKMKAVTGNTMYDDGHMDALRSVIIHYSICEPENGYPYHLNICPTCCGLGMISIAPNVRGVKRCPHCNGSGNV